MRTGFLGAIVALAAGAGLALGQTAPAGPSSARSGGLVPAGGFGPAPVMAAQPGAPGGPGSPEAAGVIGYPPPANWESFAPSGPPGDPGIPRVWFSAEYLLWFAKNDRYESPLVTTGAQATAGIPGLPGTFVRYPRDDVNGGTRDGLRVTFGSYLDLERRCGIELSGFAFNQLQERFSARTNEFGSPLIARPFVDTTTGTFNTLLIGSPETGAGEIVIDSRTQTWGAEINFVTNLFRSSPQSWWGYNLTVLAGFRHVGLQDSVDIRTFSDFTDGAVIPFDGDIFADGTSSRTTRRRLSGAGINALFLESTFDGTAQVDLRMRDRFKVTNEFYGGQLGVAQEVRRGRWLFGFNTKVALGAMCTSVNIKGESVLHSVGDGAVTQRVVDAAGNILSTSTGRFLREETVRAARGGLYALSDQIGRSDRNTFAVVPELTLSFGYQFSPTVTGFVGYNVLYMTNVVRATDLVTTAVNPLYLPVDTRYAVSGTPSSGVTFRDSDYWIQGVNFGLSIRY